MYISQKTFVHNITHCNTVKVMKGNEKLEDILNTGMFHDRKQHLSHFHGFIHSFTFCAFQVKYSVSQVIGFDCFNSLNTWQDPQSLTRLICESVDIDSSVQTTDFQPVMIQRDNVIQVLPNLIGQSNFTMSNAIFNVLFMFAYRKKYMEILFCTVPYGCHTSFHRKSCVKMEDHSILRIKLK